MKKAIEDAGYEYLGIEGEDTGDLEEIAREKDLRNKRKRFMVGFAVGIPLMILMHLPSENFKKCVYMCWILESYEMVGVGFGTACLVQSQSIIQYKINLYYQ